MNCIFISNDLCLEIIWFVVKSLKNRQFKFFNQIKLSTETPSLEHIDCLPFIHEIVNIIIKTESQALFHFNLEYNLMILDVRVFRISFHYTKLVVNHDYVEKVVIIILDHWNWLINVLVEQRFIIGIRVFIFILIFWRRFFISILFFIIFENWYTAEIWRILGPEENFVVLVSSHCHCTCQCCFNNNILIFKVEIIIYATIWLKYCYLKFLIIRISYQQI